MSSYAEVFSSKLDWAMPFQRTGKFPLDRSSIFSSYADALAYAKQDETDSRKLGGTSYVGQIIAVYGNNQAGTGTEVAAYIITAVGESAALMKLAQTTATGDFGTDIQNLQTSLSALEVRVKALEDKPDVVDTNTTYEFATGDTTDGSIRYTAKDTGGNTIGTGEIQVKGWDTLVALATGRSKAYVYANKDSSNYIADVSKKDSFRVGDLIYFTDINMADEWVAGVLDDITEGSYYTFAQLETEHPDLTGYATKSDVELTYAKKTDLQSAQTTLQTNINNLATTVAGKAESSVVTTLQGEVDALEEALGKIDVTSQITAKINELDVAKVGGADGSYIKSIEQIDGKIVAISDTLPTNYDEKGAAAQALLDAKSYTDEVVGDIGETTIKEYVDGTIGVAEEAIKQTTDSLGTRITTAEGKISTLESDNTTNKATISNHGTRISTLETNASTLSATVEGLKSKLDSIEQNADANIIEIVKVGGKALTVNAEDRSVNIESISTDLLVNGEKTLVLDCGNASQTKIS